MGAMCCSWPRDTSSIIFHLGLVRHWAARRSGHSVDSPMVLAAAGVGTAVRGPSTTAATAPGARAHLANNPTAQQSEPLTLSHQQRWQLAAALQLHGFESF